jgi:iron complex outermembrane receptor protein
MSNRFKASLALLCTTCMSGIANAQSAQEVPSDGTEILVTAQRRSERLQDVPISIVALDENRLKSSNITNTAELGQLTPGLVINQQGA